MIRLEAIQPHILLGGVLPGTAVTVVSVQWFGSEVLALTYRDPSGQVGQVLLYRDDEPRLEIVEAGRPWRFDGDGALFRLVSEAHRLRLAYLFDPLLAVHTSFVDRTRRAPPFRVNLRLFAGVVERRRARCIFLVEAIR